MDFNYKNIILKDIFNDQEITDIYKHIEETPEDRRQLVEQFSHTAYLSWLPQHVVDTIVTRAQEASDKELVLRELSFARYEKVRDNLEVRLTPHRDETFREPRVTVDIQLKSNIDWPIVVEGKEYLLKDNEALTFAGTHQVHWRTKREFSDGEFMDMIFCHFSAKDYVPEELGPFPSDPSMYSEHDRVMKAKADFWTEKYNES